MIVIKRFYAFQCDTCALEGKETISDTWSEEVHRRWVTNGYNVPDGWVCPMEPDGSCEVIVLCPDCVEKYRAMGYRDIVAMADEYQAKAEKAEEDAYVVLQTAPLSPSPEYERMEDLELEGSRHDASRCMFLMLADFFDGKD